MTAMSVDGTDGGELPHAGSYFYLSYAHALPLEGQEKAGPDRWVRRFFGDLSRAVEAKATPPPRPEPGFIDQEIPIGVDWKAALLDGLGGAQVLVPLYSPGYFNQSWSGREWACFADRMKTAGLADPLQRIVPVLWVPLPRGLNPPGYQAALDLGAQEPAYRENGMQALLRLGLYRDAYQTVLAQLAVRVVQTAQRHPVRLSAPKNIESMESPFIPDSASAVLWIAVVAATDHQQAEGLRSAAEPPPRYGSRSVDWRPYPSKQALPLSAYAAWHAEQLDFAALVTGLEDRPKVHNGPCVALIDPRVVADPPARDHLRMTLRDMPKWVLPLLVLDELGGSSLTGLAESARELLSAAVEDLPVSAIHHTTSFKEFLDVVPALIAEAERRYIRYGPAPVPVEGTSRHYRLRTSSPEGEKTDG
jgi:hypothetical protein